MSRLKTLALLIVFIVLVACDEAPIPSNEPTTPPSITDAEGVAGEFLTGWANADYGAMYALLSPKALLMSPDEFTKIYTDVDETLRTTEKGKSFEILRDQTKRQGDVIIVKYNMTFESGPLGTFTDENRTMRLVLSQGKWRISWSTMDIFEGMAGGATLSTVIKQSKRGTIYDRNGKAIAMDGVKNYAIKLLPGQYPRSADDCFAVLADILHLEFPRLKEAYGGFTADQYKSYGFTLGTLSEGDYNNLQPTLDAACNIWYIPQTTRFYYGGSFAAQTVGYLGKIPADELVKFPQYNAQTLVGRAGIEQFYEKELAGTPGAELVITSPDGITIRRIEGKEPGASQDIHLTLDRDIQLKTEKSIASAYSNANWRPFSSGAAALVLDANNGNVLAIASYPTVHPDVFLIDSTTFDADVLDSYTTRGAHRNRVVQELYAPGSVFKIISSAAVVETGAEKMTDTYTCYGWWDGTKFGDKKRLDWIFTEDWRPKNYHDLISFRQALTASCDAYYWNVGVKLNDLDPASLARYGKMFGLAQKSGIEFLSPIEAEGSIPDPDSKFKTTGVKWGLGDTLNVIIGQGNVLVTPLQIARMMVPVANGGTAYAPHIVEKIGAPEGTPSYEYKAPTPVQLQLSQAAIQGIEVGLCDVTRDQTLGTAWYLYEYWDFSKVSVCGKTGTAQTGSPYPNGWFAAYAGKPGEKPDIVVVALVERSHEGSQTAAPIVRRIIEEYYNLPLTNWPDAWYEPYQEVPDPELVSG